MEWLNWTYMLLRLKRMLDRGLIDTLNSSWLKSFILLRGYSYSLIASVESNNAFHTDQNSDGHFLLVKLRSFTKALPDLMIPEL